MKLKLSNIGKIQSADIEINGITVIAGDNNTGKSTIGKALFAIFNSFFNIEKKITSERKSSIQYQLESIGREYPNNIAPDFDYEDLVDEMVLSYSNHPTISINEFFTKLRIQVSWQYSFG